MSQNIVVFYVLLMLFAAVVGLILHIKKKEKISLLHIGFYISLPLAAMIAHWISVRM
ncbi:hypothetical protein PAGL106935_27080 [Paenibacillus glucanolyticus]